MSPGGHLLKNGVDTDGVAGQIGAGLSGGAAAVGDGQPGRNDRLPVGGSVPLLARPLRG
jgi:hypothetical protein